MHSPGPARNSEVLAKRVRRLLRIDHGPSDRSELSQEVLPFLRSLGSVVLIGGAIRDVARAGRGGFSSDLDFVVYGGSRREFASRVEERRGVRNRFGGYALRCFGWKVDVWHIDDTWAKTAGHVKVTEPPDLLNCTFFDWDSALYEVQDGRLIVPADYFERLNSNVMDIRLEVNPNPTGSLVRALRRAALWGVKFGPKLTAFSRAELMTARWEELVALDMRAFTRPVLRYLNRNSILEALETPIDGSSVVTWPIPSWGLQLDLPLSDEVLQ